MWKPVAMLCLLIAGCSVTKPTEEQLDFLAGPGQVRSCVARSEAVAHLPEPERLIACRCVREVAADVLTRDEATLMVWAVTNDPRLYRIVTPQQQRWAAQLQVALNRVDAELLRRCLPPK